MQMDFLIRKPISVNIPMPKSIDRSRKHMQKWLMAIIQDQVYLLG